MIESAIRLPFSIENVYQGLARVNGMLILQQQMLTLEFQVKDALLGGFFKSRAKSMRIPLMQIESVRFKKSFFGDSLTIQVTSISLLEGLPTAHPGELKLSTRKQDRERAQQFESRIGLLISELRLDPADRSDTMLSS
jgi:hypothetical protein